MKRLVLGCYSRRIKIQYTKSEKKKKTLDEIYIKIYNA